MPIAYWCILAAVILAYIPTALPKRGEGGSGYDNNRPRETEAQYTGFNARAYGAHMNGLEAFPFFAVAVLTADYLGDRAALLDVLAMVWVGIRVIYIAFYLKGLAPLRSAVWAAGFVLTIAIFTLPAWG